MDTTIPNQNNNNRTKNPVMHGQRSGIKTHEDSKVSQEEPAHRAQVSLYPTTSSQATTHNGRNSWEREPGRHLNGTATHEEDARVEGEIRNDEWLTDYEINEWLEVYAQFGAGESVGESLLTGITQQPKET